MSATETVATESNDFPFDSKQLKVPRERLAHLDVIAAIDRGGTLSKIVYASREGSDEHYFQLSFDLFKNSCFENGLRWMRKQAILPKVGSLRVTGVGGDRCRKQIEEIVGLDVIFIDEFVTHVKGLAFLIDNFPVDDIIIHDDVSKDNMSQFKKEDFKFNKEWEEVMLNSSIFPEKSSAPEYPILMAVLGSAFPYSLLHKDGKTDMISYMMCGGKTFLGLSKLLLDTSNYEEIVSLAEKGWRGNVDTQVKELLEAKEGNYGFMPQEFPIFSFGKAAGQNLSLDKFRREDLAHALISHLAQCLVNNLRMAVTATGHSKLRCFLVGNWTRHEVVRREMRRCQMDFFIEEPIELYFLNNGHTGALGAMLTDPKEVENSYCTKTSTTNEEKQD